jgi:gamma-glutamyltranspeptidase
MWSDARAYRPLIMGRRGAVAANHPLAAQAGLLTLQAGGNAFDAAVAISVTLATVEPINSSLGGDGFYHAYHRASGEAVVFNGTGAAPQAATPERYAAGMPAWGPLSVSPPGLVAGLGAMHRRWGRRPWGSLFDAAIFYARDGFAVTHAHRHFSIDYQTPLAEDRRSAAVFLPGGAAPAIGAVIRQSDLAVTLQQLAAEGADGFYRGALARRVAAGCAVAGTLITAEDLARTEADEQAPIEIDYRGYTVREAPPNSMGWVLLQELKIAEQFDLARLGAGSPELVHLMVEIKKLAFADRERYSADPRFFSAPLERLLSKAYAAGQAKRLDMRAAAPAVAEAAPTAANTTYFCVVDGEGNAVSGIQSINSGFGSGVTAGDTGILLNNRMTPWHLERGHPNRLAPGKRVRHTMNPLMVFKDGELWCAMGTPGGDFQVQVNFQILTAMIDFHFDPQQACEMPRWSSTAPGQHANYPHDNPDALNLESRFSDSVRADLAKRGHNVVTIGALDGPCSVEIIRRDGGTGVLTAGSDPRLDGWALAW